MLKKIIGEIQDYIHPMHVWCRLCKWMGESAAKRVCIQYEYVYGKTIRKVFKLMIKHLCKEVKTCVLDQAKSSAMNVSQR